MTVVTSTSAIGGHAIEAWTDERANVPRAAGRGRGGRRGRRGS